MMYRDSPTRLVVAGIIGAALIWTVFLLLGWRWGLGLAALLAYEGWTLANSSPHDTISDIIRAFARRQLLIPWLFGFAFGIGVSSGYIHDPYVIAGFALLQGHFFFTLDEMREEAIKQEVKAEIKEEKREMKAEIAQDKRDGEVG